MPFWKKQDAKQEDAGPAGGQTPTGGEAAIVVASLAGRADLLPDFSHPLGIGGTKTIGRDEECDIQIVDRQVSRQHVEIRHDPEHDQYYATDMKSANGTFVNDHRINREVMLMEDDVIEIGDSKLIFTREKFEDHQSALRHFRSRGERGKGTLIN